MELQREAFTGLMEYYKKLPLENKRSEIINELEEIISSYSKICMQFGSAPDMMLSKEMLNLGKKDLNEEEFLHALFAYINALQDISAQFIEKMTEILSNNKG